MPRNLLWTTIGDDHLMIWELTDSLTVAAWASMAAAAVGLAMITVSARARWLRSRSSPPDPMHAPHASGPQDRALGVWEDDGGAGALR